MRLSVISDVHANHAALHSVLTDIRRRRVAETVCLGDLVGYNCRPHETLALLRRERISSVHGNHDLMAVNRLEPTECGPNARAAMLWTRTVLSDEEREYLAALPPIIRLAPDVVCLHSALGDPVVRLRRPRDYVAQFEALRRVDPELRVCFTGHLHQQMVVSIRADGTAVVHRDRTIPLDDERAVFHFVNPGSVGHPRGADARAAYAIHDSDARTISFERVTYDWTTVAGENARHGVHTDLGSSAPPYFRGRLTAALTKIRTLALCTSGRNGRER